MNLIHFGKSTKCNAKNSTKEGMEIKGIIIHYSESTPLHVETLRTEKEPAFSYFYRPQTKLRKGNVFTPVCSGGSRISPRRGRQLPGESPTYDFAIFSRKLHEIERTWAPSWGARPSRPPPLRSATSL